MLLPLFQVDAFTNQPFSGNPAAVCFLPGPRDERWMQNVAREMNLSETAFLYSEKDGFFLRWFTPTTEVDLCGHATLAAAHLLWEEGGLKTDMIARFYTRSGLLSAEQKGDWIELDFPAEPEAPADAPADLIKALGIAPKYVGKNRFDYLIEVDSEETLRKIEPDFPLLKKAPARGVMVTSRASSPSFDFVSRFFGPAAGINEDPVTGSAHCCLGPFWEKRLNKKTLIGYQASSRGGIVRTEMNGDRVLLGGQAVTVLKGAWIGGEVADELSRKQDS